MQNQASGRGRTYVLTRTNHVIGYYNLAPASVVLEEAAARVMKGHARYPVPVILMAQFAVKHRQQGKGYGKALFRDALRRALARSEAIDWRAFLVHAKDEEEPAFYLKYGMEDSPTNRLHLLLLFKDVRQTLEVAG